MRLLKNCQDHHLRHGPEHPEGRCRYVKAGDESTSWPIEYTPVNDMAEAIPLRSVKHWKH